MRRLIALAIPVLLVAVALTGCVATNLPTPARDWLAGQDGVTSAEVLSDTTDAWSSHGLVRGELKPGITDQQISALVGKIQQFSSKSGGVAFWLGLKEIDFGVSEGDNTSAVALWRNVLDVDGVVSGVVYDGDVRVRTLRPQAVEALGTLMTSDSGVRLEAFTDRAALDADRADDIQYDQVNTAALDYRRPAGCGPADAVLEFSQSLAARDEFPGATIDLCAGITIDLPLEAPFAAEAVELRSELDSRGLSEFSVQLNADDGAGTAHFAAITPGDAKLLPVLAAFEGAGAPALSYSLGPDGNLAVTGYSTPTADLLKLIQASPVASGLAGIGLEGSPVAILGTANQLPSLLEQALALAASSDAYGSVKLGQGFGSVTLSAPGTSQPDVDKAVADLRATGVTDGRFFSVYYAAFQADIANNIAALSNPDYTDPVVMQSFVDTWNAAAPPGG